MSSCKEQKCPQNKHELVHRLQHVDELGEGSCGDGGLDLLGDVGQGLGGFLADVLLLVVQHPDQSGSAFRLSTNRVWMSSPVTMFPKFRFIIIRRRKKRDYCSTTNQRISALVSAHWR